MARIEAESARTASSFLSHLPPLCQRIGRLGAVRLSKGSFGGVFWRFGGRSAALCYESVAVRLDPLESIRSAE